jgi:hypothetical protein
LSTNITLDDATGSLDVAREAATYFGLSAARANLLIDEVQAAVSQWNAVAMAAGATALERSRMRSAFLVHGAS